MHPKEYDIDKWIARSLAGDLSADEKQQFESWMQSDPKNAEELNKLKAIWNIASDLKGPAGEGFNTRWEKISVKTFAKKKVIPLYYKLAATFAGIILVGTMAAFWFLRGSVLQHTENSELKTVMLPDSSSVTLNSASTIEYNPRLWFFKRTVHLEGEAFFNVEENGSDFTVTTSIANTKVLGTSFNIKQRYNAISISCLTGKVGVSLAGSNLDDDIVLEKGTKCIVSNAKMTKTNFDVAQALETAWMERKLVFEHTPMRDVFEEISRFYDIDITYSGKSQTTFSGTFESTSAEEALKIVCLSGGLRYQGDSTSGFKISE
jgi:ferric-dicitrate binding protein FerR (iron transport regulator)